MKDKPASGGSSKKKPVRLVTTYTTRTNNTPTKKPGGVPAKAVKVTSTDGTRYITPGAAAKRAAKDRRTLGSIPSRSVPAKASPSVGMGKSKSLPAGATLSIVANARKAAAANAAKKKKK